jgi:hypothetical protein
MEVFYYVLIAFGLVLLAYAMSRAASFAFFRTRLEYLRSVFREINGGNHHE